MHAAPAPDFAPLPGIAVRPDVLWLSVAATVEGIGASRAIPVLRDAAAFLARRVGDVAPGATLEPRRLRTGGSSADRGAKHDRSDVQLGGVVQVPLAEALDFWARAELVARVGDAVAAVAVELGRHKPSIQLGWREPVARVADEEPYRVKLLERQAASLCTLVGTTKDGPTPLVSCDAVAEVVQAPVSLDEVRLALAWKRHTA